ncbi:RNA-binding domain-containing protein [Pseudomonas syringae]|uniref:RNA-binding domain-containing protein n=1 Tax=Pseudomonas syringae TaxID=317 RepID=UPI003F79FA34
MNRSLSQLKKLLLLGESQNLELKARVSTSICGRHVCAFLNSQGGYLLCGVDSDGQILGVDDAQRAAQKMETQLKTQIQPPVLFSVEVQEIDDRQVLVIEVPSGKDVPYAFRNDIYIRHGESTVKASIDVIRDMVLRKQIEPERWERLFASELDEQQLSRTACHKLLSAPRIPLEVRQSDQGLLHQLQLLSLAKYGRLTNAADVLLAQDPSRRHPQARVRAVCYSSKTSDEYPDLQHFAGPMAEVIEQLSAFIMRNTPVKARFSQSRNQREDLPLYPEMAIREGVVNAFAHRDYSSFSGGIKVEISPARLQIWNSGSLPEGVDANKLQQGHISVLRNPDIAHALYLQGYMEKLGRGSVLIRQACQDNGLAPPVWHSEGNSGVTLTFFTPEVTPGVAPEVTPEVAPEVEKLIVLVNGDIKRSELQHQLKLTDAEHFRKRYLSPALEQGVIAMTIPEKPTSSNQRYRLTNLGKAVRKRLDEQ